jgi:hypothetical protein
MHRGARRALGLLQGDSILGRANHAILMRPGGFENFVDSVSSSG